MYKDQWASWSYNYEVDELTVEELDTKVFDKALTHFSFRFNFEYSIFSRKSDFRMSLNLICIKGRKIVAAAYLQTRNKILTQIYKVDPFSERNVKYSSIPASLKLRI